MQITSSSSVFYGTLRLLSARDGSTADEGRMPARHPAPAGGSPLVWRPSVGELAAHRLHDVRVLLGPVRDTGVLVVLVLVLLQEGTEAGELLVRHGPVRQ